MMDVKLISVTPNAQELIEYAGRACYRSQGTDTEKFIRARIKEGHLSLVEHASATFDISGISRACSHQLVRHRIASYSQESMRYVGMDSSEFIVPDSVASNPLALLEWKEHIHHAQDTYNYLRSLGIRKEDARFVLPIATQTRIIVTMNFRSLLHFFEVRCDKAAQWEIRQLALEMLKIMYEVAPAVFGGLYEEFVKGINDG